MNRAEFARKNGATCVNERFAWSYINEKEKFVMFGAWDHHNDGSSQLIISERWERNENERRNAGYRPSMRHIERVIEDGFDLYTFPMTAVPGTEDGPTRTLTIDPKLTRKSLFQRAGNYYAIPFEDPLQNSSELQRESYIEGATYAVVQTAYERNPKARQRCLQEHGYICSVCGFDFENIYGEIGKGYIHVHHLIPVSERKTAYEIDPINDLRPVCPNCHAMIHKKRPPYKIEEIKEMMEN